MNATLTNDDYLQVLGCIEAIHRCRTLADFPEHALRALSQLVPSNLSAFNEVNIPRKRIIAITDRPLVDHAKLAETWSKFSGQHPLVRYNAETGDGQAVKISDFLSPREYHRLDLYRTFYRPLRAEDQMTITIRSDNGFFLTFALNRARRDFSESDRIKLNLVRPHLLQAYANAEELADHLGEKADLKTALRETGHGLIALESDGNAGHATPGARECLARYFPEMTAAPSLPAPVAAWLRDGTAQPFTARHGAGRLILRSPQNAERRLVLLSEEHDAGLPDGPRLTARESEVLHWLAKGKTNPEIATILGVAAGTVKMHVERILGKLGVDNRTAATVFARETGMLRRDVARTW